MSKATPKVAVNVRDVPQPVRDHFKAYCARRGYGMHAAIIALMRKTVAEDKPIEGARK